MGLREKKDGFSWPDEGVFKELHDHLYLDIQGGSRRNRMMRLMLLGLRADQAGYRLDGGGNLVGGPRPLTDVPAGPDSARGRPESRNVARPNLSGLKQFAS